MALICVLMEELSLPCLVLSPQGLETWDKAKLLLQSEPWARTKAGASETTTTPTRNEETFPRDGNAGKLQLINIHVRNPFVPFPTSETSTDNPTRQIKMTFYFVKNTWKIKMKALPGFANNHQNPQSHQNSVFKRCFLSPAPFSMNSLTVEWSTRVSRKKKKKAFWANIRKNPRLVQCRCCYITLEQRHKIPTWNLHFNFSKLGCSQGETRVIQEGKAELSPALQQEPEELKGQQINPTGWNHVGTQTFGISTSDPCCKARLPRTPDMERRRHKWRWGNIHCPPLRQKMYPWNWDFRIQVSEDIKQPLLQSISPKKHRSTCCILKICTEINNNCVFHGAFHFFCFAASRVSVFIFMLSEIPE